MKTMNTPITTLKPGDRVQIVQSIYYEDRQGVVIELKRSGSIVIVLLDGEDTPCTFMRYKVQRLDNL